MSKQNSYPDRIAILKWKANCWNVRTRYVHGVNRNNNGTKSRYGEADVDMIFDRLLNVIQLIALVKIPEKFVTRTPVDAASYAQAYEMVQCCIHNPYARSTERPRTKNSIIPVLHWTVQSDHLRRFWNFDFAVSHSDGFSLIFCFAARSSSRWRSLATFPGTMSMIRWRSELTITTIGIKRPTRFDRRPCKTMSGHW